jgi:hypothetical protein
MKQDKFRIRMRRIPIKKINIAKYNPRKDLKPGDWEYESIKRSILTHGYIDPMVWNEHNDVLVGGHQRLKILQELGETKVDVSVVNVKNEKAEMDMNVDLNQSRGEYDPAKLWAMQQYYEKKGWTDFGLGFKPGEVDDGVKLWGINVNYDKQCYREYTPFSLTSYIGGPFMVHIDTDLRFDERLPLKEDYDYTLQHLNKYRKVLRVNKFFYVVKQMEQVGGCATYRNLEREIEQLNLLRKKWGSRIVQNDSLENSRSHKSDKKRTFDVNPIIRVPIGGI